MKKLWKWLQGKKTYIGAILYIALAIFGKGLSPELLKSLDVVMYIIFGFGLGDKAFRELKKNGMFKKPPKANI